jgi:hypothetical protein
MTCDIVMTMPLTIFVVNVCDWNWNWFRYGTTEEIRWYLR